MNYCVVGDDDLSSCSLVCFCSVPLTEGAGVPGRSGELLPHLADGGAGVGGGGAACDGGAAATAAPQPPPGLLPQSPAAGGASWGGRSWELRRWWRSAATGVLRAAERGRSRAGGNRGSNGDRRLPS